MFKRIRNTIDIVGSTVASSATGWRGTMVSVDIPKLMPSLVLYDVENNPDCRIVREALTELHLDCEVMPCPDGGSRFKKQLQALAEISATPVLHDKDQDVIRNGLNNCLEHLFVTYGGGEVPAIYKGRALKLRKAASRAASLARGGRGQHMRPASPPAKMLELWSFESSPFCRRVRERLCEMQIPYLLHNLGKEQIADIGVQIIRMKNPLKDYQPIAEGKRADFLKEKGMVQVPYLFDPNGGQGLFESTAILEYLDKHYG